MPLYVYAWLAINLWAIAAHVRLVRHAALDAKALREQGITNGRRVVARGHLRRALIGLLSSSAFLGAGVFSALRHLGLVTEEVRVGLIALLLTAVTAKALNAHVDVRSIKRSRKHPAFR